MVTDLQQSTETVEIQKTIDIAAPIDIAFAAMLDELGPDAQVMKGMAMNFKLEAWPGGRWYRDLGNNAGHLWGHVQVIKPPTLLEICGPLMMPYPAVNFIQYRFTAQGTGTRLMFVHRGMGRITAEHREGMPKGWGSWIDNIRMRSRAEGEINVASQDQFARNFKTKGARNEDENRRVVDSRAHGLRADWAGTAR